MKLNKIKLKSAFSLVEVLIVVFIISVAFTAFYTVSTVGTKFIIEAKNRLAAIELANERMEIVRNLKYDKIGTQGSIDIPGNLLQEENATANGRTYKIYTSVRYVDDPLDGLAPADTIPNDYKAVKVTVAWDDSNGIEKSVSLSSRFVPVGLEANAGGSPLSINVMSNENGSVVPVNGTQVHITNSSVSPVIDDKIDTDPNGQVMLPSARIANGDHLVISKTGYETIETMTATPTFIPIYKDIDVVAGDLNQYSFEQNKLSTLHVKSVDGQGNSVANIGFSIEGGKIIGHDDQGNVVYNMPLANQSTSSSGQKDFTNISPGNYNIVMSANANYEFVDFDPAVSPAVLPSGTEMTYTLKVADKSAAGFLLKVSDAVDGAPIANADVKLTDSTNTEIFSGKKTSLLGALYYPDSSTPLAPGDYTLEVQATGYDTKTQPITIGSSLLDVPLSLTRS